MSRLIAASDIDPDAFLPGLDRILTGLNRPTPLRGIVQALRGSSLRYKNPAAVALDAAEEAVRLLPNHTGPLLLAAYLEAYRDNGEAAAGYLLRAADIDAGALRDVPDYELGNVFSRLASDHHRSVRDRLIRRLFETGWRGQSVVMRSGLARELIASRLAAGDRAGAKAAIPQLVNPTDVYDLLTLRKVETLWPDLETWAGPRQEQLWRLHLVELRSRWKASADHDRARDYIYALRRANHHSQVVADFSPLFVEPDPAEDYDLLWVAAPLASSLAELGRWKEADALLTRLLVLWPLGSDANALNLLANRGRLRHESGDHAGAVADLTAAVTDGAGRDGEVSSNALAPMHRNLACALHELGKDEAAIPSSDFVSTYGSPVQRARLHLCFDRRDLAKAALLAGLQSEWDREEVIDFMQIENGPSAPSEFHRRIAERHQSLRQDPELVAAMAPYGRILPYAAGAGAPAQAPAAPARHTVSHPRDTPSRLRDRSGTNGSSSAAIIGLSTTLSGQPAAGEPGSVAR